MLQPKNGSNLLQCDDCWHGKALSCKDYIRASVSTCKEADAQGYWILNAIWNISEIAHLHLGLDSV